MSNPGESWKEKYIYLQLDHAIVMLYLTEAGLSDATERIFSTELDRWYDSVLSAMYDMERNWMYLDDDEEPTLEERHLAAKTACDIMQITLFDIRTRLHAVMALEGKVVKSITEIHKGAEFDINSAEGIATKFSKFHVFPVSGRHQLG